jgi:hypothetical protein
MRLIATLMTSLALLSMSLHGNAEDAENLYATAYKPLELRAKVLPPEDLEPKIYKGTDNKDADYQRMLEGGYDLLGFSSFEAGEVPPQLLTQHARTVKAHLVLVTVSRSGDVPASIKIDRLRQKAREQNTDTVDLSDIEQTVVRYNYHASYWVKLVPPLIGLHVSPTSKDEKIKGQVVVAVIKRSPAERAGLKELDVIMKIGDELLEKPEALAAAAKRYAGQTVDVHYLREGAVNKTTMTLNPAN